MNQWVKSKNQPQKLPWLYFAPCDVLLVQKGQLTREESQNKTSDRQLCCLILILAFLKLDSNIKSSNTQHIAQNQKIHLHICLLKFLCPALALHALEKGRAWHDHWGWQQILSPNVALQTLTHRRSVKDHRNHIAKIWQISRWIRNWTKSLKTKAAILFLLFFWGGRGGFQVGFCSFFVRLLSIHPNLLTIYFMHGLIQNIMEHPGTVVKRKFIWTQLLQ